VAETTIEWADYTFNAWVGCQRVSPGCEHCYAEAYDKRVGGVPKKQRTVAGPQLRWGPKAPRTRTSPAYWKQPLKWNAEAAAAGEHRRVFCASLADVFERLVPGQAGDLDSWRLELFELIRVTPHLDWLLLTKRPQLIKHGLTGAIDAFARTPGCAEAERMLQAWVDGEPPANVWLGTTVEDQKRADERIPHLVAVPAAVRFLSCEPLLEGVDLRLWPMHWHWDARFRSPEEARAAGAMAEQHPQALVRPGTRRGIDWVIIGGESGPGARPFHVEWARGLVRQCRAARVAPFVKQLGARPLGFCRSGPVNGFDDVDFCDLYEASESARTCGEECRERLSDRAGGDMAEWPANLRVREFPEVRRG
jgi:protein gp37